MYVNQKHSSTLLTPYSQSLKEEVKQIAYTEILMTIAEIVSLLNRLDSELWVEKACYYLQKLSKKQLKILTRRPYKEGISPIQNAILNDKKHSSEKSLLPLFYSCINNNQSSTKFILENEYTKETLLIKNLFQHQPKKVTLVGQGSFAKVFICSFLGENNKVKQLAVKINRYVKNNSFFNLEETQRNAVSIDHESNILNHLQNTNSDATSSSSLNSSTICLFNKSYIWDNFSFRSFLILEAAKIDLWSFLDQKYSQGAPLNLIQKIAKQLFTALQFLKEKSVIHGDLKPDNILLTSIDPIKVKICDFGKAIIYHKEINDKNIYPALYFMAPEIAFQHDNVSFPSDMWSLGCILYILYSNQIIYTKLQGFCLPKTQNDITLLLIKFLGLPPQTFTNKCKYKPKFSWYNKSPHTSFLEMKEGTDKTSFNQFVDLLQKIFTWEPDKRITPEQALKHPFVQDQETVAPSESLSTCTSSSS